MYGHFFFYSEIIQNRPRLSPKTRRSVRDFRLGRNRSSLISLYLCIIAAVVMPFVLVDAIKQIKNEKDTFLKKINRGAK
jgi:hypothetical protein